MEILEVEAVARAHFRAIARGLDFENVRTPISKLAHGRGSRACASQIDYLEAGERQPVHDYTNHCSAHGRIGPFEDINLSGKALEFDFNGFEDTRGLPPMASINTQFDYLTSSECRFSHSTIARMGPVPQCVLPSIDAANAQFRMKLKQALAT